MTPTDRETVDDESSVRTVVVPLVAGLIVVAAILGLLVAGAATPEPHFEIQTIEPGNATLEGGEALSVAATVENTDGERDAQSIELHVDGEGVRNTTLELAGGESETVRFEDVDVGDVDRGGHTYGVVTAADEHTARLRIDREPAAFELRDLRPRNATVGTDEAFEVTATVTNTGETRATGRVRARLGNATRQNVTLTLDPGERTRARFENVTPGDVPVGVQRLLVATDDDAATVPITVEGEESARFRLADLQVGPANGTVDEPFNVTVTVTNAGERTATRSLDLVIDDANRANQDLTLAPRASTNVTFYNVDPRGLEAEDHEVVVATDDTEVSGTVTVDRGTDDD